MALALQCWCISASCASVDDDFRRGQLAYQRGDFAAAMSNLRAPAAAGHVASQTLLAYILDNADFPEEAVRLYSNAARQGDADALAGLANLLLAGRGIAKDEKQALVNFSKAAALGHAQSIVVLADAHLQGLFGLRAEPRDDAATVAVLGRAAERGHLPSAEALAKAYRDGGMGLVPNTVQAAQWQSRVAQLRRERSASVSKAKP